MIISAMIILDVRNLIRATILSLCIPAGLMAQESTPSAANGATTAVRLSTVDELKEEFDSVPCNNKERLSATRALFERMGAKPEEISVEKIRRVENLVIRIPGASSDRVEEKIVIGAHYDKTEDGCGAIDNWTGIVALSHIYRSLRTIPIKKTVIFVAFGQEEKGLLGSKEMAGAIKKEQAAEYCAMINIDSLGMGAPQVADNLSTKKMVDLIKSIAGEMGIKVANGRLENGNSDSTPFKDKKIPALTIHALTNEWMRVLHSPNDQAKRINFNSVYLGYRLALALLKRIDDLPCQTFR